MGATLIIIGNGFDKAHGLETSYQDFVRYIFDNYNQNEEKFSVLFEKNSAYHKEINYNQFFKPYDRKNYLRLHNRSELLDQSVSIRQIENWFDFETNYFDLLKIKNTEHEYKLLNEQLITIRNLFLEYLGEIQKKFTHSRCFEYLFQIIDAAHKDHPKMTVNFNYTNTANKYVHILSHHKLVPIHGELDSKVNIPLFGYSVIDEEEKQIQKKNGAEARKFIKNLNYLSSNHFNDILTFLDQNPQITIYILGHSCGKSDYYLLSKVFNHNSVSKIHLMYKDEIDYQLKVDNIFQMSPQIVSARKILTRSDSLIIPQINENQFGYEYQLSIKKKLLS